MIDDSLNSLPDDYQQFVGEKLNSIVITPNEVFDVLKTLHIGKTSGPDGINNKILLESALQIFNQYLTSILSRHWWVSRSAIPVIRAPGGGGGLTHYYQF